MNKFVEENQVDYRSINARISADTVLLAWNNMTTFFKSIKKNKEGRKINLPKYKEKNGRCVMLFANQSISKKALKEGYLKLSGLNFKLKLRVTNIETVRIIPKVFGYVIETIYERKESNIINPTKYASIDLGLNNLATLAIPGSSPIIYNGKPLKSINQYYNKLLSESDIWNNKSRKAKAIVCKRTNKVNDYLHKISRKLVNQLVSEKVTTLVIGYNKGWKQDINLGKKTNQKFVQIPFTKFIHILTYKCAIEGINVTTQQESHTSKCSFLDNEKVMHHKNYVGKRIKRGLFKTKEGILINADVNAAYNILQKYLNVIGNRLTPNPIEACSTPIVIT